MPVIYVSVGSNSERDKNILSCLTALEKQFGALVISSIYESAAVGFVGAAFYNLVLSFHSELNVKTIAQQLRQYEAAHSRSREAEKKFTVSLDLDLLLYGDVILNEDGLQIPRAEIESCAFVLQPLAEIAPQLTHPISGHCYGWLWEQFDKTHLQQRRVV